MNIFTYKKTGFSICKVPFMILLAVLFSVYIFCGKEVSDQPVEKILVKIGDKTISVNEFIHRAEYTIRPKYCNRDNYIHKKIILNSIIAEKLLALEAAERNELAEDVQFQDYIRGRKEQAMRQWLYYNDFYNKINVENTEVEKVVKLYGRRYTIAYYTAEDSTTASQVRQNLDNKVLFEDDLSKPGSLKDLPRREVIWSRSEHPLILDKLYSGSPVKNDIIGPIEIDRNCYTVFKILGWTEQLLISEKDIQQRFSDVRENITEQKAIDRYKYYVATLMRGRKVEFERDTFRMLVDIVGPFYFKSDNEKKDAFNEKLWQDDNEIFVLDSSGTGIDIDMIRDRVLLKFDDQIWTVRQLEKEFRSHPPVFRKTRIKKNDFAEQFKLAIVDLIMDKFITRDAYKKGYEKVNLVERIENMWRDNLFAIYQRNRFLESAGEKVNFNKSNLEVVEKSLNPYIDRLQEKYASIIEIDTDTFEDIVLTNIDMFVWQKSVPFPIVVPGFPVITTDNKLDYGRKMDSHKANSM